MPVIDEKGMLQARRRAEWELGDSRWAGMILAAYFNPDSDAEALRAEKAE